MIRQRAATGTLLTAALLALPAIQAPAAAQELLFPDLRGQGAIFSSDDLAYAPTGEFDFPSILQAHEYFDAPLGNYYLYTAPHDHPGGISLFFADEPEGPWQEFSDNPIIAREWDDHYAVSHVSSPHAVWLEAEAQLFLYFHGENSTTRFATSTDGVNFEYGGVAVRASELEGDVREASYARVFEHTIAGRDNRYFMTFMDAVPGDGLGGRERRIRLAISDDARNWTVDERPLLSPLPEEGTSISGATYLPWDGAHYIAYHGSSGNIFLADVGEYFQDESRVGILYAASPDAPDNGRAASPTFLEARGSLYMFYEAGRRGSTAIALAKASLDGPFAPLQPLSEEPSEPESDVEPSFQFTDVSPSSSHFEDIHILWANGLTQGCGGSSAGTYCPSRAVTRAEMATFLMRAANVPGGTKTRFVDVSATSSHVPGIAAVDREGWTRGCGPTTRNTYCPTRNVTRAEMATFLARVLELPAPSGSTFTDVSTSSSHHPGIEAIAAAGLTNGCGPPADRTYCPDAAVTRAQMASFLVRAFGLR